MSAMMVNRTLLDSDNNNIKYDNNDIILKAKGTNTIAVVWAETMAT